MCALLDCALRSPEADNPSVLEAVLDDPGVVLSAQLNKAKGEEALQIIRSLYLHAPDDPSVREAIRQLAV